MKSHAALFLTALLAVSGSATGFASGSDLDTSSAAQPETASENPDSSPKDVKDAGENEDHKVTVSVTAQGTFVDESDFDSDIGTFKYTAFNLGLNANRRIGDSGRFSVSFDAGLINYDIEASPTAIAGDAASIGAEFDDVTTLSLTGIYADQYNDSSSWYIGGGVVSGSEDDADFGDSIDGVVLGGFIHKVNDKLDLGLGLLVRSRLDDDVLIVPVPHITYTINEFWSIESKGAGLKINYKASDSLNYGVTGEYASTTFRLNDSHSFASDGMATHRRIPVAFYAQYKANEKVAITGTIGAQFEGELEILNTSGNEVASQDLETGIFGTVSIRFRF